MTGKYSETMHRKYDKPGADYGELLFFLLHPSLKLPDTHPFLYVFLKYLLVTLHHVAIRLTNLNLTYTPEQDGALTCTK